MKYFKDRSTALRLMGQQDFTMFQTELLDEYEGWFRIIKEKLKSVNTFFSSATGEEFGNLKLPTASNKQGISLITYRPLKEIYQAQSKKDLGKWIALGYKGISGLALHFNRRDNSISQATGWLLTKDKKWYYLELSVTKKKHATYNKTKNAFCLEYGIEDIREVELEDWDTELLRSISISLSNAIIHLHKKKAQQERKMALCVQKYLAIDSLICSSSNIDTENQENIAALYVR